MNTIDQNQSKTVNITAANDSWEIIKDISVTTQHEQGVSIASTATKAQLTVNGTVSVASVDEAAINSTAEDVNVIVGEKGQLSGEKGLNSSAATAPSPTTATSAP